MDRTLRCLLRSTRAEDHISGVRGGMVDGHFIKALGNPPRSVMLTAEVPLASRPAALCSDGSLTRASAQCGSRLM